MGAVLVDGNPCSKRKGNTFRSFVRQLEEKGYTSNGASCAPATMARRRSANAYSLSPVVPSAAFDGKEPFGRTARRFRQAGEAIDAAVPPMGKNDDE